ncbi:hypothetical protein ACIQI8_20980 [Streptomyces sp. NPDC092369]|uniref:hypothetical protein n=1 Tax=Streptomyces sp. NPDC092369 TaxID=3366015 RepID=UPI00380515B3
MGRSSRFIIFPGILLVLASVAPAAQADEGCGGDFSARLKCWTSRLDQADVTITLDHELPLDGSARDREDAFGNADGSAHDLEVQVPAGVTTGEGGTVLLLLADSVTVDPDARITALSKGTRTDLKEQGVCAKDGKDLCGQVAGDEVSGDDLTGTNIDKRVGYVYDPATDDGLPPWLLPAIATALVLLLGAFFLLVRRTRTPAPATAGQASRTADADEPTRALRATPARPARSGGRHRARNRDAPARSAVVRTDLHPQGYVEVDGVLYRAVWAEPGQPPPAPGSPVDVTDAQSAHTDADVLYAFPPTAGRSAPAR